LPLLLSSAHDTYDLRLHAATVRQQPIDILDLPVQLIAYRTPKHDGGCRGAVRSANLQRGARNMRESRIYGELVANGLQSGANSGSLGAARLLPAPSSGAGRITTA
jgi:hypothetical protein